MAVDKSKPNCSNSATEFSFNMGSMEMFVLTLAIRIPPRKYYYNMRILSTLYDYNDATTKRFMPSGFSAEADVNTQKIPSRSRFGIRVLMVDHRKR
jgi:hypothetical protein